MPGIFLTVGIALFIGARVVRPNPKGGGVLTALLLVATAVLGVASWFKFGDPLHGLGCAVGGGCGGGRHTDLVAGTVFAVLAAFFFVLALVLPWLRSNGEVGDSDSKGPPGSESEN